MVTSAFIAAFVATVPIVYGHYTFVRLAVNDKWHEPMRYVRNKTDGYTEPLTPGYSWNERSWNWWSIPSDHPESMRCGRDNMAWATQTDVLKVQAGDKIEFAHTTLDPFQWKAENPFENCGGGRGTCDPCSYCKDEAGGLYFHMGPVVVHLSKAPDGEDVRTYDGTGEWVKIYTLGLEFHREESKPLIWLPRNDTHESSSPYPRRIIFNLPKEVPSGQYLLRAASIWQASMSKRYPDSLYSSQLYHSCAQIQVESTFSGSLPKGVLIPEIFQYDQPGMLISEEMGLSQQVDANYTYPGGTLWNGQELVEDKPSL